MTTATAKPIAEVNVHTGHVKIANVDPALKAALQRWHERLYQILVTLRAPAFLLSEIQQDSTRPEDGRLDSALEITEQCIEQLEKLDDEIASGMCGHIVIEAEQPAGGKGGGA